MMSSPSETFTASSAKETEPKWVVLSDRGFKAYRLHAVSPKTIQFIDHNWSNSITRRDRMDVLFTGSEAIAKRLAEQLISSEAQHDDERRNSQIRNADRQSKMIAAAQFAQASLEFPASEEGYRGDDSTKELS